MESYPGELLVGVFPLVFCTDATLSCKNPSTLTIEDDPEDHNPTDDDVNDFDNPSQAPSIQPRSNKPTSSKSQFDRFLNAIAAALMELDNDDPLMSGSFMDENPPAPASSRRKASGDNMMMSLFRGDDDDGSDAADDEWLMSSAAGVGAASASTASSVAGSLDASYLEDATMRTTGSTIGGISATTPQTNATGKRSFRSTPSIGIGFRLGRNPLRPNSPTSASAAASTGPSMLSNMLGSSNRGNNNSSHLLVNTSYAKALQHGQGFAQRARIVSISTRHGFPPSKDPTGEENRIHLCFKPEIKTTTPLGRSAVPTSASTAGGTLDMEKLITTANENPVDGILPSGWLEKHAHALPSVLLVVAQVFADDKQEEQNQHLMDTLENLQINLAPKRQCQILIIGLVQSGVSMIQAEQWSQTITSKVNEVDNQGIDHKITLLDVGEDLDPQASTSTKSLQQLHKLVRDASLSYYLHQARRAKLKLHKMGRDSQSKTPLLLPLAIRYCFKVAVFYEFQWKHEKSLKFMVEAYRHAECYYRYLLQVRSVSLTAAPGQPSRVHHDFATSPENKVGGAKVKPVKILESQVSSTSRTSSSNEEDDGNNDGEDDDIDNGEAVELALPTPRADGDDAINHGTTLLAPLPPNDMVHQCRAVADWLNFKLLYSGFVSNTEGGLLAASTQWQKHGQAFCSPRKSFVSHAAAAGPNNNSDGNDDVYDKWYDWSYVARQRVVVSQLLERYPPRALGDLGSNHFDDVLLRCSPWRTYQAAAEAYLTLGVHVRKSLAKQSIASGAKVDEAQVDSLRSRYVGGLDKSGLLPMLEEEAKQNHREKALDCILRAINLFGRDRDKAKSKSSDFVAQSWSRSAARMYYLAGGILHGLDRHAEATPHLETAVKYSKGWNGLELVIRRMLIECYAKTMSEKSTGGEATSQTIASMILDSYFNAEMSNSNLRRALENFGSLSGSSGGSIKWYRDCIDEADSSLPFSFALTFPSTTHATAGDCVEANVLIKSNVDYAVHVNSVTLLSLAGKITIPSNDLLSAKNANEGSNGGIIIQANTEILVSTKIELPKDLDAIAIDETGNGGEKEGVAGKGSFSKSARPRTAGITSAAGARLVSEQDFGGESTRPGNGQWSLRFLGGKPVRCDGIRLVFYPVYVQASGEGNNCEIELTIEKKQPKTAAKIKRTPFEEDNYVASAWSRPRHLPLNRGPRCLRVLPPMADLVVTNVTDSYTNGKALEGTVNRILIKLQAGPDENCTDLKFRISCTSLLITLDGATKRITAGDHDEEEKGTTVDRENARVRTPVLVRRDPNASSQLTEYGYQLPRGWTLCGDGQGIRDAFSPVVPTLKGGEATYAYFDFFRPSPNVTRMDGLLQVGEQAEDLVGEWDICKTDFDLSISYRQERPKHQTKPTRGRRRKKGPASSPPPGDGDGISKETTPAAEDDSSKSDLVFLEYTGSVLWNAPIQTTFSPGPEQSQPSGNRHPSNSVPGSSTTPADEAENEMVLIDGERVTTKCVLEAAGSADGLFAEIKKIRFEDNLDPQTPCEFRLVSGRGGDGLLYQAEEDDPSCRLRLGSKFAVAWTTDVKMKNEYAKGSVSAPLGAISVDWSPIPLDLPEDVAIGSGLDPVNAHGPLVLTTSSTCRFMGPPCYVENAPFHATMDNLPALPRVAIPFDVIYRITNKTNLDQKLKVLLSESTASDGSGDSDGVLLSGIVNGSIALGPYETKALPYIALATRAGRVSMPTFRVSCERYQTWVIRDDSPSTRCINILP